MIPIVSSQSSHLNMSQTMGSGQLIRFPTITKLTYDGDNHHLNKTIFKSDLKIPLKSNSPNLPNTTTSCFRVIEVAPDDNLMKICVKNMN